MEESEFVDDCREPMEEEAGKGLALSSKTQTLDGEDAKTVEVLVDSGVCDVIVNDENPKRGGSNVANVEDNHLEKTVSSGDDGGESQGIEREEESVISSGENEVTADEKEECEVEDNGGGACDVAEIKAEQEKEARKVNNETGVDSEEENESAKKNEEDNNEMDIDSKEAKEEIDGLNEQGNQGTNRKVSSVAQISHEEERTNDNQKEGGAMEVDYAAEESTDASVVQTQDVPTAEVDENDANVVKETETDERKGNANPNTPTEDAAPGNIQDLKTETGNVSLKENKKATHVAEEVATQDATLNAESHDNPDGIEHESNEAGVALGEESPPAATECPREASDAVMGSEENQEDKETVDKQVAMREEDEITHEAPSIDANQEEATEMEENRNDSDDGTDSEIKTNGVKRKADVLSEDSTGEGRKTVSLAKVSFAQTPSFKIGASIARAASQMAGSPSVLKGSNIGDKNLSVESFVSLLHRVATDPVRENIVSELAADFFLDFRNSTASQQVTPEKVTKKRGRPSNSKAGGTEAFEFEEMGDTYWTDRVIHNGGEEQTPPTERGNYQIVPVELKPAQVKKTRRPYRRRQSQIIVPLPSASDKPAGFDENAPAELIMNFSETDTIPPEKSLSKMFRHFGPIKESQTEVDSENNRARVVYRKGADAEVAYNCAGRFSIFGTKAVNYELSYTITEAFTVQPYVVSLGEEDATLSLPS